MRKCKRRLECSGRGHGAQRAAKENAVLHQETAAVGVGGGGVGWGSE